ncbi:hypothetical protein [Cellvibrio japonicus]|nr:hypothetical protein [Cellvibrio japonicus]QEI12600.1 hypothetical protein FY117_10430 [Cellvibrio japonicus]QEI16174.1 hypothetical protein FY116_10435 [Cellvibrio japonicus]QEI19752.1 hypothetical protein FY115_10430 [Cellvibrio japonicus]
MFNPISYILRSNSPRGIKVIALSLLVVLVSAAPIMFYIVLGPEDGNPIGLGLLFAFGALVGHVGFVAGMLLLIWDNLLNKKNKR